MKDVIRNALLSEFVVSDNKMYGYDKTEVLVKDFFDYLFEDKVQSWWCDGVQKRMLKAKIQVDEYCENIITKNI